MTFTGSYSSVPNATQIKWKKQDGDGNGYTDIDTTTAKYTGSSTTGPNPKLVINSVKFTDGTSYRLEVINPLGYNLSNPIKLEVKGN